MFTVDVHEFNVIFTHSFLFRRFKDQVQRVGGIFCFDGDNVIVLSRAKNFGEGVEVES